MQSEKPAEVASDTRIDRRSDAWTDYWAQGALHSCAGTYEGLYGGGIGDFWAEVFSAMPDQGVVLDLCCGNGALTKALVSTPAFTEQVGLVVDAVDAARVMPAWLDELASDPRRRVTFHSGMDVGRMSFEDERFDLCMSQYGIEYADVGAWDEVRRVMRPGATFAAVVHHVDSLPVRIAREELSHLDWLQSPEGLVSAARDVMPWMVVAGTPGGPESLRDNRDANHARTVFGSAMQQLEALAGRANYPDVLDETRQSIVEMLQSARNAGEAAGRRLFEQIEAGLARQRLRAAELVECALDGERLRELAGIVSQGEPVRITEARFENDDIAGWALLAKKPG